MIFVKPAAEPADFDERVRQPGRRFLRSSASPSREVGERPYWRRAAADLHNAYDGICAYTCHWIALDTGWRSVEHFVPKSIRPALAYEWSNFRLVCGRMNGRKGAHDDVLDPFKIQDPTFVIRFPSLQVGPANGVGDELKTAATRTIDRLKLNDELCISSRLEYVKLYCRKEVGLDYLRSRAPFIHREIVRQRLETRMRDVMRFAN